MKLAEHMPGETVRPLAMVIVEGAGEGTLSVRDGRGREYLRLPAGPRVELTVGGALGHHTVSRISPQGEACEVLSFRVDAETHLEDEGGDFAELLSALYYTMLNFGERHAVRYEGRIYRFFVSWLRDHVHVLKGMKYFSADLQDGIDLYRDSQRADGMIWDNVQPHEPHADAPTHWSVRFDYGGFCRPFDDYRMQFVRIPVENDVEYLFVEGLYYTWKAVGDDAWMATSLDAAVRALEYSVTSPCRWSARYSLLKRGYTIDTWDFQSKEDCLNGWDPMVIDKDRTRFGVMFGDNTGYARACEYLAEMLARVAREQEAACYLSRAAEIRARLNALAWNGRFYTHHVPEDENVRRDLGVDEASQVALSNAYSLNRNIDHSQCAAIIRTYQGLRERLPEGSPGEWYTIYPPFRKGFGEHNDVWQYMNAGVTPIVAGELAHGAFEHGFEAYGANILRRLLALVRRHDGVIASCYTGARPVPPPATFSSLDVAPLANCSTAAEARGEAPTWPGGHGSLDLPPGRQTLAGIPFDLPDPAPNAGRNCIVLSWRPGYDRGVSLPVGQTAACIYLLHTFVEGPAAGVAGAITLHYADGSTHTVYTTVGRDILPFRDWRYLEAPDLRTTAIAWRSVDRDHLCRQLLAYGLDNPHPERRIERITLRAAEDGAVWAVLGITLSDRPACFPPPAISYGIPDNWGAAAVVYALIEGLAGVVDDGVCFDQATVAPRWPAAGTGRAAVTVRYPASDGYVAYRYWHEPEKRSITLQVSGSGESCRCHLLLPEGARGVTAVRCAGQDVPFSEVTIEGSHYVDCWLKMEGVMEVSIAYTTS